MVEISALKGTGINEAATAAIEAAGMAAAVPQHTFSGVVEHAVAHIEEAALHSLPEAQQRWYAIKIFERDEKVLAQLKLEKPVFEHIEKDILRAEKELDDDAESIITNERYVYIASIIKGCCKKPSNSLSISDKIDRVVTNRWAALPIFAVIMFLVYFISVTTVGTYVTDFTNDGLFGEGWHLFGIGTSEYNSDMTNYAKENVWTEEMLLTVNSAAEKGIVGAEEIKSASEVTKAPTCTAEGTLTYTCTRDASHKYTEAIAKTAHNDADGNSFCDACNKDLSPAANCSCNCHKTGFMGFIWKLQRFFFKLFNIADKQVCACGEKHW